jgi:hypothetical protein
LKSRDARLMMSSFAIPNKRNIYVWLGIEGSDGTDFIVTLSGDEEDRSGEQKQANKRECEAHCNDG